MNTRAALAFRVYHMSVEAAAAEAIAGGLPKNRRNFHVDQPPTGRLVVVRFHIPFWRRLKLSGKQKTISPERKKWPTIASDC